MEANIYALAPYAPAITRREKQLGLFPDHSATYGYIYIYIYIYVIDYIIKYT